MYYKSNLIMSIEEPKLVEANGLVIKPEIVTLALAIYRPPGYKNINNFIHSLNDLLTSYASVQHIIILGDITLIYVIVVPIKCIQ